MSGGIFKIVHSEMLIRTLPLFPETLLSTDRHCTLIAELSGDIVVASKELLLSCCNYVPDYNFQSLRYHPANKLHLAVSTILGLLFVEKWMGPMLLHMEVV